MTREGTRHVPRPTNQGCVLFHMFSAKLCAAVGAAGRGNMSAYHGKISRNPQTLRRDADQSGILLWIDSRYPRAQGRWLLHRVSMKQHTEGRRYFTRKWTIAEMLLGLAK